jgi:hypothetical protein
MYIKLPINLFSTWGLDLMILMGANPLRGPLEGVGPCNGFDRIEIITYDPRHIKICILRVFV